MRTDRLSSLRHRLKPGSFEFGALIQGVSTLEGENEVTEPPRAEVRIDEPFYDSSSAVLIDEVELTDAAEVIVVETVEIPQSLPAFLSKPEPVSIVDLLPAHALTELKSEDRLRDALQTLGARLLEQTSLLRAELRAKRIEEGGFILAQLNQTLELLTSIDLSGDISRKMKTAGAPPIGRSWPQTAWTVSEFAASPFSALLPADADEMFVQKLIYTAWGVAVVPE